MKRLASGKINKTSTHKSESVKVRFRSNLKDDTDLVNKLTVQAGDQELLHFGDPKTHKDSQQK